MKLHYYQDTDSFYIDFRSTPSSDSKEVGDGVIIDFDSNGNIVGIDIQNASKKIDFKTLETVDLPMTHTKSI